MSNIVNDNGGCGNGRDNQNLGRPVVMLLQVNLGPIVAAPLAVVVEEGDRVKGRGESSPTSCVSTDGSSLGNDLILFQCDWCFMLCVVPKKEFPKCFYCNQPSLFIPNAEINRKRDDGQSSSK
ncbi:hypothetical protein BRADI_4g25153v3 [Brachypodium distachyon]|uniref:Uncharacterized protein n=1 Tax=Brachypodium distachyon TaxID=15368 RepID=A0A2K2CQ58_BRADI|nr:hypothetical protein BRADI_4g25153v3 [Brachypodium distachyon]